MGSKFVRARKGFKVECFKCGSSMLRHAERRNGTHYIYCFCCGAGDIALTREEADGLGTYEAMGLVGVEAGEAHQILPRINRPGYNFSQVRFNEEDLDKVRDILQED